MHRVPCRLAQLDRAQRVRRVGADERRLEHHGSSTNPEHTLRDVIDGRRAAQQAGRARRAAAEAAAEADDPAEHAAHATAGAFRKGGGRRRIGRRRMLRRAALGGWRLWSPLDG